MISDIIGFIIVAVLPAYLVGSIPFGIIVAKLFRLGNLREIGSGNIGATNVVRAGGKKIGALVLLLDALKGGLGVSLAALGLAAHQVGTAYLQTDAEPFNKFHEHEIILALFPFLAMIALNAVLIGHVFPIWLRFRGGKGISTMIGTLAAIGCGLLFFPMLQNRNPDIVYTIIGGNWAGLIIFLGVWIVVYFATKVSALAGLSATGVIVFYFALNWYSFPDDQIGRILFGTYFFAACLIFYRHKDNIRRLLRGEEYVFRAKTLHPLPRADESA